MADHVQQQILDALQAVVIAGATVAGTDVYVDRIDPLPKGKRAAVLIREGETGDDVQPSTIDDVQQRDMEVEITCTVRSHDGGAAEARAFGLAVEKIVSPRTAAGLRALCKTGWRLVNSRPVQSGEGEEAVVSRVLSYRFTYLVRKSTPDVVA